MAASWTNVFFSNPWLGPLIWIVLHSLDFYLTLYGAHLYHSGANRVITFSGSYELNPLFQSAIEKRRYFSKRFIVSLLFVAVALYVLAWLSADTQANRWLYSFAMGALIFTRLGVLLTHLTNVWLFRRILRPNSPITGAIRYDRQTSYYLAAHLHGGWAIFLGVAACFSPSAWLYGGCLGTGLLCAKSWLLGLRHRQTVARIIGEEASAERALVPAQDTGDPSRGNKP